MFEYVFNDQVFVTYTCPLLWWIFSIVVVILEQLVQIKAPYGRYNVENTGIPVRIAWFIQELPSFAVPFYLVYNHWNTITTTKLVIISFFLIHYFQRFVNKSLRERNMSREILFYTFQRFHFSTADSWWQTKFIHDHCYGIYLLFDEFLYDCTGDVSLSYIFR